MTRLQIIDTGGTIGGILGPGDASPKDNRVIDWLAAQSAQLDFQMSAEVLCKKDSRALCDQDREALAERIAASASDRILVPHGTFTMPETGVYLQRHHAELAAHKTVILVGALIPLGEPGSDAPAALQFALLAFDDAGPGVWVAMSQRLWDPSEVQKDPVSGEFVARRDGS